VSKRVILSFAIKAIPQIVCLNVPRLAYSVFDAIERCWALSHQRFLSIVIVGRRKQDISILTISIDPDKIEYGYKYNAFSVQR
jgi:hypothetical protein